MQRTSYRKSSPDYGEENDTRDYGFKLKIKKNKNSCCILGASKINYLLVDHGNVLEETNLNNHNR